MIYPQANIAPSPIMIGPNCSHLICLSIYGRKSIFEGSHLPSRYLNRRMRPNLGFNDLPSFSQHIILPQTSRTLCQWNDQGLHPLFSITQASLRNFQVPELRLSVYGWVHFRLWRYFPCHKHGNILLEIQKALWCSLANPGCWSKSHNPRILC